MRANKLDTGKGNGAKIPDATLENLRQQQASGLAYFDSFWMFAVLTLALVFAVLFMKRSVAEKGARVGFVPSAAGCLYARVYNHP